MPLKVQKKVDVYLVKKRNQRPIEIVQADTGIELEFTVKDFEIPAGTTATLFVQKPSGKFVYQEVGVTVSGNIITVDLENQAIVEKGNLPYQVSLKNGKDEITSFEGLMLVYRSLKDSGAEESKTVIRAFEEVTAEKIAEIQAATLEQIALVEKASEDEQKAIEAKGEATLATIPEDYQETYNMADRANRTKADAIVQTVHGETIAVNDSSNDYFRNLNVYGKSTQYTTTGKNRLNNKATEKSANGVSFTVNKDKSITINGTATSSTYLNLEMDSEIDYQDIEMIGSLGGGNNNVYMVIGYFDADGNIIDSICTIGETEKTFTLPSEAVTTRYYMYVNVATFNNVTVYPMIRFASITDVTYEPYTDGKASPSPQYPQVVENCENTEVSVYGKNFAKENNILGTETNIAEFDSLYSGKITVAIKTKSGASQVNYNLVDENGKTFQNTALVGTGNANGVWISKVVTPSKPIVGVRIYNTGNDTNRISDYIMILLGEHSITSDTDYAPYNKQSLIIPNTLCGIPVTDASIANYTDENGQMWCADYIDYERGVLIQRVLRKLFSKCDVFLSADGSYFFVNGKEAIPNKQFFYCNIAKHKHNNMDYANAWNAGDGRIIIGNLDANGNLVYSTVDELFNNIDAVEFLGILAEQIETPLAAEEIAAYKALHSNYPNTTVLNNNGAGMMVKYGADTKLYIDNKFAELAAQLV